MTKPVNMCSAISKTLKPCHNMTKTPPHVLVVRGKMFRVYLCSQHKPKPNSPWVG